MQTNNHDPTNFRKDTRETGAGNVPCNICHISNDYLLNIYYALAMIQALDYSNEQYKHDP